MQIRCLRLRVPLYTHQPHFSSALSSTVDSRPGTRWTDAAFLAADTTGPRQRVPFHRSRGPYPSPDQRLQLDTPCDKATWPGTRLFSTLTRTHSRQTRHAGHRKPKKSRPSSPSSVIGRGLHPQCGGSTCDQRRPGRLLLSTLSSKLGSIPSHHQPRSPR